MVMLIVEVVLFAIFLATHPENRLPPFRVHANRPVRRLLRPAKLPKRVAGPPIRTSHLVFQEMLSFEPSFRHNIDSGAYSRSSHEPS